MLYSSKYWETFNEIEFDDKYITDTDGMTLYESGNSTAGNDDHSDNAHNDYPQKNLLKREVDALALKRLEDAARTEKDFLNVIDWWDRLDRNRERRERYHEIGRDNSSVPLEWGAGEDYRVIPASSGQVFWQEMMKGNFLDLIFNSPLEIHELVEDGELSIILRNLKDEYKELLYYLAVRLYSTAYVGRLFGQTDRNIRKKRAAILNKIRKQI